MDEIDSLLNSAKTLMTNASENFDFSLWLSSYLKSENKTGANETGLFYYAYLIYSTDTTNKDNLSNMANLEKLGLRRKKQNVIFGEILKANEEKLSEFFKRFPEYESYSYILTEKIEDTKHTMSAKEEELAGDLQRTGGDAWGKLHEQIISNLRDKESGKTFNELRNNAFSANPETRKKSWEKEISLLQSNQIAIAAALNNLKGETVTLNRRRSWQDALDRACFSSRLERKTLGSLISVIEESLPEWRKYFQLKADVLRKNKDTADSAKDKREKGISFYDLFAPISIAKKNASVGNNDNSLLTRTWSFSEARDYIIQKFSSFSSDMGSFAKKAFDNGWIDAETREGKVGGAYDQDFPLQKESRILSNFTGTFSDVITLSHELGHAYHFNCIKDNDFLLCEYPMTLAETASTFAETIVKQDIILNASKEDKIKMIELDLQDVSQVLVDILCRFYFEKSVFEEREKGELTSEDFCRLMKNAQEKSYGSGLNSNRHEYMWSVKSHYYSTELDFYNFPYAFGQLFASGLYERYCKEGKDFVNVYQSLLKDTGRMSCEELCKKAGFNITKKDFWRSGMKRYLKEIQEFESLIK